MEWIKCSEQMPPYYEDVLVCVDESGYFGCDVGYLKQAEKQWELKSGYYDMNEVIYWAYLPELPEED